MLIRVSNNLYVESVAGQDSDATPAHVELEFDNEVVTQDPDAALTTCDVSLDELVRLADALLKMADDLGVAR